MITINPSETHPAEIQKLLQSGIAPRPIALVSTISETGIVNLSPFSFFNMFSTDPPIIGFSAARRLRDGSTKDTYNNIKVTKECVVQVVTFDMVEQASLSSTEYDANVDEFQKAGFTAVPSELVKPPRVKESPFQMECILHQMIEFGNKGGAGNLALCEVVRIHVKEELFESGVIHPDKIQLVGRMSGDFYTLAAGESVFSVAKPLQKKGIGIDMLPEFIRSSRYLTGNELAKLANVEQVPHPDSAKLFAEHILTNYKFNYPLDENEFAIVEKSGDYKKLTAMLRCGFSSSQPEQFYIRAARIALQQAAVADAWNILYLSQMG